MVAKRIRVPFTEEEYLALEAVAKTKHEFVHGRILGMAGAEIEHNQIASNIMAAVAVARGDRPCRALGSDQRVKVERSGHYFYPDVTVLCREPQLVTTKPRSLVNPETIFEVSSPSTEAYDAGAKWRSYQQIRSLMDYVLVSTTRVAVRHFRRIPDGWDVEDLGAGDTLFLIDGLTLPVDDFYRFVELKPAAIRLAEGTDPPVARGGKRRSARARPR